MRKLISIVLVLSLMTMLTGVASAIEAGEDVAPALYTSSGEEKVYCNATVEDDFAENRVMVVLSNDASLKFSAYEAENFSEIACAGVQDLSQASGRKIQAKAETVKDAVMSRSVDVGTLDTSGIDTYNQVLCLELEESGKENVLAAIEELMKRDDVVYAGPDYVLTICSMEPNDEFYDDVYNWAPDVIDLPEAWEIATGSSSVVVGVLDTGISSNHEDLISNIDHDNCADFTSEELRIGNPEDQSGHGTYVAGIIGAVGNNEKGIAGVCWNVSIVSLQILNNRGRGYSSYVGRAIDYANELDIPILNLSAGWYSNNDHYDEALKASIENYEGLFVCSAGNDDEDNDINGRYSTGFNLPNMIVVGASTSLDEKSAESNYGLTSVDLFAPSYGILCCFPFDICDTGLCGDITIYAPTVHRFDGYHRMAGTSVAAPYVTGVAALLLSQYPDLLPCEIKNTILSNVDNCGTMFDDLCISGGRLNAYNALTNIIRHTKTYINNGNLNGHSITCVQCQYSENHSHSLHIISRYSAFKHSISCECGYVVYESHLWNGAHTKCMVCGYDDSRLDVLHALKPDED